MSEFIIETLRLAIRKPELFEPDINLLYELWNDPEVMKFVGFPNGLNISREQIIDQIKAESESEYDCKLIVLLKSTNKPIGECKLGRPDDAGISETDVKLLPQFWGQGYGKEVKRALVNYLFKNTSCSAVKASPNKMNLASQKMQEAVGAKKVGEGVYVFPENMKSYIQDVPYYVYMVFRESWETTQDLGS